MKQEDLQKIIEDDDLGLLDVKTKASNQSTPDERLIKSFEEINTFIDKNGKEPQQSNDILEKNLYFRLKGISEDLNKSTALKQYDRHNLFKIEESVPETIDDIFSDDDLGLLENNSDIFTLKNIPQERMETDFIARRKPCKNFKEFEKLFVQCQQDLRAGIKTLGKFNENQIQEGQFFVLNGILLYINKLINVKKIERGYENKYDGRTHLIFENGTESNMKFRSLCKRLFENGKHVSNTVDEKLQNFYNITNEDKPTGFIYILKSQSKQESIQNIGDLYKIGYCETAVAERIKNAVNEPTYLMAPVKIIAEYKTFNMNTQKFELLLHKFFGHCCVSIDIFDNNGTRHTPREWFQIPYNIIEQAIKLIITGEIIDYSYDSELKQIVKIEKIQER